MRKKLISLLCMGSILMGFTGCSGICSLPADDPEKPMEISAEELTGNSDTVICFDSQITSFEAFGVFYLKGIADIVNKFLYGRVLPVILGEDKTNLSWRNGFFCDKFQKFSPL